MNVPGIIAIIVMKKLATLNELQTIYGSEDAYDLLEIIAVENRNTEIANTRE